MPVIGQIIDDFSGDDVDLSIWSGDTDDFIIDNERLRLSAPSDKGRSILYTPLIGFIDEAQINLDFALTFNPSNQNKLRIWIMSTDPSSVPQEGYYLLLGETGSDDGIDVFFREDEEDLLVASGANGKVASNPIVRLEIIRNSDQLYSLSANYDDGTEETITFSSETILNPFFVIECIYTSTRSDRFVFDNFYFGDIIIDSIPPVLINYELEKEAVTLSFNERISETSLLNENFVIDPFIEIADLNFSSPNQLQVNYVEGFAEGIDYTLEVINIRDLSNNRLDTNITFSILPTVEEGDLALNEILFNPKGSGSDYVEIINTSDQALSLQELYLFNSDNRQSELIIAPTTIFPGEIIVWTENKENVLSSFPTNGESQIFEQELPSFNNDNGNVSLAISINGDWEILDSYDYDEKHHLLILDDEDGVSLERIDLEEPTNDPRNWISAASEVGFGSPGLENSVAKRSVASVFRVINKVFSPDGDGRDEEAEIEFELNDSYVANAFIYDLAGRRVKQLWQNITLATSGTLLWDGRDETGSRASLGIYVVLIELFNLDGQVIHFKEELVIAQ